MAYPLVLEPKRHVSEKFLDWLSESNPTFLQSVLIALLRPKKQMKMPSILFDLGKALNVL